MKRAGAGRFVSVLALFLLAGCGAPIRHTIKPVWTELKVPSPYEKLQVTLKAHPDSVFEAKNVRWNNCTLWMTVENDTRRRFDLADVANVTALRRKPGFWHYATANAAGLFLGVYIGLELVMREPPRHAQSDYQGPPEYLFHGAVLGTLVASNFILASSSLRRVYTFEKSDDTGK